MLIRKKNRIMIKKRNIWNIFVIKNVILKRKTQRENININIYNDSKKVTILWKKSENLTNLLPLQLVKLEIDLIKNYNSFWIKITLNKN